MARRRRRVRAVAGIGARLLLLMSRYAFLILPSHNRVYAGAAPALARAELAVLGGALPGGQIDTGSIAEAVIGGIRYVTFEAGELTGEDIELLGNLSSLYALFAAGGEE